MWEGRKDREEEREREEKRKKRGGKEPIAIKLIDYGLVKYPVCLLLLLLLFSFNKGISRTTGKLDKFCVLDNNIVSVLLP